jgi:hypothetical protein
LCAALAVDPDRPYRAQLNFGQASNISPCDALLAVLSTTRRCRQSERNPLAIYPDISPTPVSNRLRQAIAWPIHTISLILDLASSALGCLAARIAGDDCRVDLCTSLRCPLLRVWSAGYEFGKPTAKIRRTRTKDGGLSRLSDFPPIFCRDFPSLHSSPWRPLKPALSTAEMCTKTSLLPLSG